MLLSTVNIERTLPWSPLCSVNLAKALRSISLPLLCLQGTSSRIIALCLPFPHSWWRRLYLRVCGGGRVVLLATSRFVTYVSIWCSILWCSHSCTSAIELQSLPRFPVLRSASRQVSFELGASSVTAHPSLDELIKNISNSTRDLRIGLVVCLVQKVREWLANPVHYEACLSFLVSLHLCPTVL